MVSSMWPIKFFIYNLLFILPYPIDLVCLAFVFYGGGANTTRVRL